MCHLVSRCLLGLPHNIKPSPGPTLTLLPIHSDCDAPLTLINATFDWLEANFKDEVDFVVWTGDNARHDIDSRVPRSLPEIFELNRYVASRIRSAFGKVPVVTSIGNNGAPLPP